MTRRLLVSLCALVVVLGCDDNPVTPDAGPVDSGPLVPEDDPLRADCDQLVPEFCSLPYPSDYWLVDDATTASGHRLAVGPTTLPRALVRTRAHVDPTPFNTRDGWSVNASILTYLPGATATGLPNPADPAPSLLDESPTILLNTSTMLRVPHWSEIDESVANPAAPRTFIVRPVVPLDHSTRYIVAIRNVVDASGATIPASDNFASLRDDMPGAPDTLDARRAHFEDIFTLLAADGVDRDNLQLAWDFTTGSLETDTAWMLSVRDQALAAVGADGPEYTFEADCPDPPATQPARCSRTFTEAENASIRKRIYGRMTVPLFLDMPDAGARLNFGSDGMPAQNGTAEFDFVIQIPRNATGDNPMHPIQYGHGLLGDHTQAEAGWLADFGNTNGYIPFGVDWSGMAEEDFTPIILSLSRGTLETFATVPERLHQGIVNSLLAMRMMLGRMARDPQFMDATGSIIDTSAGFYTGDSQGGIFGGTYMALSTDVTRGILGVPGQPYHLLLNRSTDFDQYLGFMRMSFADGVDIQIAIATIQMLWDRAEPGSYTRHIMNDLFPGTPAHQVILQVALGDHQVSPLGAHIMARAIGANTIEPQTRSIFGIDEVAPPHMGSGIVEFDFGLPPETYTNVPQRMGDDPHGSVRRNPRALAQTDHFYRTGEITHTCDGVCDPE